MKKVILKTTQLEGQVLKALADAMYAEPGFSDVGPTELSRDTTIDIKRLRGVLSSLTKKGWVDVDRREDEGYAHNSKMWITYLRGDAVGLVEHWRDETHIEAEIEIQENPKKGCKNDTEEVSLDKETNQNTNKTQVMKKGKNTPSVEQVENMNSTELRKVASELNIKSYAKYKKAELLELVKAELKPKKSVSKSAMLRKELKTRVKGNLEIDSGSLMKVMKEKHDIIMHRSFVITVRNSYLKLIGAK